MAQVANISRLTVFRGPEESSERRLVTERDQEATRFRLLRPVLIAFVFLLPVLVWPGLEQPFSQPKLIVWVAVVLCGILAAVHEVPSSLSRLPKAFRLALATWVGALGLSAVFGEFASLDALLLPLAGAGWFVLLLTARPDARRLSWALVFTGSTIAAVAVAQFLKADPFSILGWISDSHGESRMRVFATLGNPDFVAASLSVVLPLTLGLSTESRWRRLALGLSALQLLGILATGSRAPVLALVAVLLWSAASNAQRHVRWAGVFLVIIIACAASSRTTRDLKTAVAGRLYICKVSAPHLVEHIGGLGPGGFAASFPTWETRYWHDRQENGDRKFAGIEDHAHNDYLELLADYGAVGLLGFLGVIAVFLWAIRHETKADVAGASAGVVALCAISLVDFPLMRPAETFLLWTLIAVAVLIRFQTSTERVDA